MSSSPRVSIVMAVYNGERYAEAAIRSVLTQTLSDLELIVVDDASTDRTLERVRSFDDPRIRLLSNASNIGAAMSAARGFAEARGEYVGRLDADDVSTPDRLSKQVFALDSEPSLGILGSSAVVIDERGARRGVWQVPSGRLAVAWTSLLRNPFINSATLFRRELFRRQGLEYDLGLAQTEDYDLWARALCVCAGDNLLEPLVYYRRHPGQATSRERLVQLGIHDRVAARRIGVAVPGARLALAEVTNLRRVFVGGDDGPCDPVEAIRSYLNLFEAFAGACAGDPALDGIRREVAAAATRALVTAGRDRRVPGLVTRILRLEPRLPLLAARSVSRRALRARPGPLR
jgi:glycosyltransferase involved in cell wall biosynthesis